MSVQVVFLGSVADRFGVRGLTVEAPAPGLLLSELKARLADGDDALAAALAPPVRAAVDQEIVAGDVRVRPGQEVAFLPVYSGG